jgi:non-canonical poly(A) RNA polymerase PAPD5/7
MDPRLFAFSDSVRVQPCRQPSNYPWCHGNEYIHSDPLLCLHRELLDFALWLAPTNAERHSRLLTISRFKTAVSLLWPSSKLICTGSSATSSTLPMSDLDLVVFNGPQHTSQVTLLQYLKSHLDSHRCFSSCHVINARVPIIKGVDKEFGFSVDIAIDNVNGILNIERHQNYFRRYSALFPLLLFLKLFLFQNGLDTPFNGGISSNTLIQMVVYIIQSAPEESKLHCGELLIRFLECFGRRFNYNESGITTRYGGRLFNRSEHYQASSGGVPALCIEDPQFPGSFLGGNAWKCDEFRDKCQRASIVLRRNTVGVEQSILARVITRKAIIAVTKRRAEIMSAFPLECFELGNKSAPYS